jgi:hypothetical protein
MKFRKKPVIIDALQWFKNGDHPKVIEFKDESKDEFDICKHCNKELKLHGWIPTLEGGHIVCPSDWIITGVVGENYPCKADIFLRTYEPVENKDLPKIQLGWALTGDFVSVGSGSYYTVQSGGTVSVPPSFISPCSFEELLHVRNSIQPPLHVRTRHIGQVSSSLSYSINSRPLPSPRPPRSIDLKLEEHHNESLFRSIFNKLRRSNRHGR